MIINVLGNTLDKEQTQVALLSNYNTIVIAGAGSGKSLTIVGKIKYLVLYQNIKLTDILCLTFTNEAASSLAKKINQELKVTSKVYTFHKLALEIIKDQNLLKSIAPPDLLEYLIFEILSTLNPQYLLKAFYIKPSELVKYTTLITRFIHLFQANYNNIDDFDFIISQSKKRDYPLLKLIQKIYAMYEIEKQSQNLIDFDDMISIATNIVKEKGIHKNYKYIIIDEYQDTSQIRENLIKAIINQTHAYLTVVGDDFQSIYRFSGCDLNNFLNFSHNFKPAKTLYLTNTYRNSQELINIAGSFVMANPYQIKKNLHSSKTINKPIIILYYRNAKKDFLKALKYINKPNLMILGRNNNDIYQLTNNLNFPNKNIYYLTIHKSKGLEEDNILIINLTNNINSLPSQIKDENLLKYVIKAQDFYPYEEERRLFYVALTRTKNYCYLYVAKKNPSPFIKELINKYKKDLKIVNL